MPNPVIPADIAARWRPLSATEEVQVSAFIADAWALLLSERRTLESDIAAGEVSLGNVVRVVSAMVLRVMKNPEGKSEEQVDDYRYRRDVVAASGELVLTDRELASLTPLAQDSVAFTVSPYVGLPR